VSIANEIFDGRASPERRAWLLAAAGAALSCHRRGLALAPPDAPLPLAGTWGGLRARTVGKRQAPKQLVVLLHGWGAPGTDLVPLAEELGGDDRLYVFPEGPLVAPGGGRAWWPIDIQRLQSDRARGLDRDLREEWAPEMEESRKKVAALTREVTALVGLPFSAVVWGGFSQGAMLATDLTLSGPERPAGLAILSGSIVKEKAWEASLGALPPGLPVFMSHGRVDPVLPFQAADELQARLRAARCEVTWLPFAGGHEIPWPVLEGLRSFLDARLAAPKP